MGTPSPISLVSDDDATYPDINGLAFVVHDHTIADDDTSTSPRVGCGILQMVAQTEDYADLSPIDGTNSGISGFVRILKGSLGLLVFGSVTGFDGAFSVPQQDGAGGAHVHSGSSCADAATQGSHYWQSGGSGTLPSATSFDPYGANAFIGALNPDGDYTLTADQSYDFAYAILAGTNYVDVTGKAFVVHDLEGDRAACGVLEDTFDVDASSPTPSSSGHDSESDEHSDHEGHDHDDDDDSPASHVAGFTALAVAFARVL